MSNVKIDGNTASITMAVTSKYLHYQQLRITAISVDGKMTKGTLQGWNGKRWVRAKAKAGKKV